MISRIRNFLAHPLTKGLDIDDPDTTALRLQIVRSKPFLLQIYREWYQLIASNFNETDQVLELGSGAGFMKEYLPKLITSELFETPGVDRVLDAHQMDVGNACLDGIVMTDVLHHIPDCDLFFHEALRVLKPGGKLVMIEPWYTPWSGFVYKNFHHEPFEPDAASWKFPAKGPLSSANGAIPWMVFKRDHGIFEARYPELRVEYLRPLMPLVYLLSGGIATRNLLPGWFYPLVRFLERHLQEPRWGMFAYIVVKRV